MTIQSVRVACKSIMTVERFAKWLQEHSAYTVGELNLNNSSIAKAFVANNTEALFMKVRGSDDDQLALTKYSGAMSSYYCVRYLERMTDDDGEEYFSAMCSEDFGIHEMHKAIEAFVLRWESDKPYQHSLFHKPKDTRKQIVGRILGKIPTPERVALPYIDETLTPQQIADRLHAQRMVRSTANIVSNDWHKSRQLRELLLRTKHLDNVPTLDISSISVDNENVQIAGRLQDPGRSRDASKLAIKREMIVDEDYGVKAMVTIFEDGKLTEAGEAMTISPKMAHAFASLNEAQRANLHMIQGDGSKAISSSIKEVAEAAGVVVFEDSDKVGYTGNKCNHGTGSLDHIGW